ncbi:DUF885 domain-containing protein [Salinibacterium sp. dk2585]|uniref:DUF885 domain-containing protein n=1 Tax=unclassified Salinibacterium TaxID=2632331 RepID=UPI0011C24D76|nr:MULTISPECIES: DUF885 domain-containing protein [unclassified Salinibacterium]QEE61242.1 DUF885 domain-containing protein [Salinibacterium sp. dk2585]TXK53918.1 DUF885 domain-containing protein [Salinibacterium sp. dk5596]
MTTPRTPTPVDEVAERWVNTVTDLDPTIATYIGVPGRLGEYGDYSPAGAEAKADAARSALAELRACSPVDDVDRVTAADLGAALELELESHEARLHLRDLNVLASPATDIREIFDLMPTETEGDWSDIASRMGGVPDAVDGYIETLRRGISEGVTPARRQVLAVAELTGRVGTAGGFFSEFAHEASDVPESLSATLSTNARLATEAYSRLTEFLRIELAASATEVDAVGRESYALHSRRFLGATIDLDEAYEWGIEELARMRSEQEALAHEISPGASVEEAIAVLDSDPSRILHGTDALQAWMQDLSDRAVAELGQTQFDIPQEIRRLECMIAPTQNGGIYYTGPSDDFTRPGRMWWSVPVGITEFSTWRETTTVYHEGVPGHHLQIGQAVVNRGELNTWRRQLAGTSGHAEGWALYAERLMEELGYLNDPGDRFGMLDAQRMRAARVVLDIGVHLGKRRLDGEGRWDFDYALAFFRENCHESDPSTLFEVNRYFGWPGQAPSYKVGQRLWMELRDEARRRGGADFDVRSFHRDALALGGVGLDTLRSALLD